MALAEPGTRRVSANGYDYTKIDNGNWRLTHHLVAEKEILHRPLREDERVIFGEKGKTCLDPSNIKVVKKSNGKPRKRIAVIEARIQELQAELEELKATEATS